MPSKEGKIPLTLLNRATLIKPHKGGQTQYLKNEWVDEMAVGGSLGGGKTFLLVISALGLHYIKKLGKSGVEFPEYRAIIFRRKTTELTQVTIEADKFYIAPPFNARKVTHKAGTPGITYIFPSGAQIYLSHLQHEQDKYSYQGSQFTFVAFDEASHFTQTMYYYILSRLRTVIPGMTTRARLSFNPSGNFMWIKKRFIDNTEPGKVFYAKPDLSTDIEINPQGIITTRDDPEAKSRIFIPARIFDNLTLMENDPMYIQNIRNMGERYTRAYLYGDLTAFLGSFFTDFNPEKIIIDPFKIDPQWELFAGLDPGYSSPAAFILMARDFAGNVYILFTYKVGKRSPDGHAKAIKEQIEAFPYIDNFPEYCATGVDGWAKRDRHALVSNELTFIQFFEEKIPEIYFKRAITDRVPGWWSIKQLMSANNFFIFKGYNDSLADELLAAEADENDQEDIDKETSSTFHCLDALRYGVMSIPKAEREEAKQTTHKDDLWNTEPKKDFRKFW